MTPIRFAVRCDGVRMPAWQARVVQSLLEEPRCEVCVLFSARSAAPGSALWRAYWELRVAARARSLQLVDLREELSGVEVVSATGDPLPEAALRIAREADLDVLVDLGAQPLTGDVLDVPRLGVWAFEHGSGGAPGLGEILAGDPVTPVRLVRLRAGGVDVLHEGGLPTDEISYSRHVDRLLSETAGWVVRTALEHAHGGLEPRPTAPLERTPPRSADAVALRRRLAASLLRRQVRGFTDRAQWNVGIVDRPIASFVDDPSLDGVRWIRPAEREGYIADPFGLRAGESVWILAEHYGFDEQHGRIVAIESRGGGPFRDPVTVLDEPVHLSYPFLLEHEGEIYCMPERSAAREVALYRAVEFPTRWERLYTLVDDLAALDATLFRHEGTWWLFLTDGAREPVVDLHAFYATDLGGPWRPHALNPLKTDVAGSRMGGTFFRSGGSLYRPAQDGSETYGGALALYEVLELTPTRFRERRVATVRPHPEWPVGVHTLSALGDLTLVDGKRWVLSATHIRRQLRIKLGR